jgi:hypothetical protein
MPQHAQSTLHPLLLGDLPLFERWNPEALEAAEKRNPRVYRRGYEQRAFTEEELLFPSWTKWRDHYRRHTVDGRNGTIPLFGEGMGNRSEWFKLWLRYGGVDMASEHRPGDVILTLAASKLRANGGPQRFAIVAVNRGKWTHPQLVDQIGGENQRWEWERVLVESNAQQSQLVRWAERMGCPWRNKAVGFTTTAKKWDDYLGLPGIEVELSQGNLLVPYGEWENHEDGCECGWCTLDAEMSSFTRFGPGTPTSDCAMGLYFGLECAKRGGNKTEWGNFPLRNH